VGGTSGVLFSNDIGGTWTRYPYVYVHVYNESSSFTNYRTLYSNNPYSNQAVFKVPMAVYSGDDIFFTLRDSKTIQVVKFRPDLPIRFKITFPNGEVPMIVKNDGQFHSTNPNFVQIQETVSPIPCNPLAQVNAMFAIKRIAEERT